MASCSSDRVMSALEDLERRREEVEQRFSNRLVDGSPGNSFSFSMLEFERQFGFLKVFLECIHKWSDADEVVPHLGSLLIKIQAAMEGIADQLTGSTSLEVERAPGWTALLPGIRSEIMSKRYTKRAVELRILFKSLRQKVVLFGPEIEHVYDSLTGYSLRSRFRRCNYDQWQNFMHSVQSNLKALEKYTDSRPLEEQISAFQEKLTWVTDFLGRVVDKFPNNPKIEDFIIHIGRVALFAAHLSCHWWARRTYLNRAEDFRNALFYLEQRIDFTNPLFLDINLSLLKCLHAIADKAIATKQVSRFVELLLNFPPSNIQDRLGLPLPCAFLGELVSMIASASNLSEEYIENVRRFLTDVKAARRDEAPLKYTLESRILPEGRIGILNMLAKIWLVKLEIFLREQLTTGNNLQLSGEDQQINSLKQAVGFEYLTRRLESVREYTEGAPPENVKNVFQFLKLMDEVTRLVASASDSNDGKKVQNVHCKLLLEIALLKAESHLMELHQNTETRTVLANDRMEPLCERLKFLIMFVSNQLHYNTVSEKLVFSHITEVASGVISLCYSIHKTDFTEEIIKELIFFSSHLLDKIEFIMVELKEIYLHIPQSVPRTNGVGFIDYLLRKLTVLLNHKADLVVSVKHHIKDIFKDLEFFRPFLWDILKQYIEVEEFKGLGRQLIDVAYEAEYLIDAIVGQHEAEWYISLWLFHVLKDIRLIKMQVEAVYEKKTYDVGLLNVGQTSRDMISQAITPRIDEAMVSLSDQEEVIIDRLTVGTSQRNIVAVVGMPGIGKTTLAKKIYGSLHVSRHFHIRAWCCVSQAYNKRELLLQILSYIITLADNILEKTDEDLEWQLYQNLKQKRYLIVMDDIWNAKAWDDLEKSLPNDGNGSRILLTSRLKNVALEAQPDSDPHSIRLLSDSESWELLQLKIFLGEVCPEELVEVGKDIANHCRGLPLAVVAIAGLLERTERHLIWWKQIAESLSSRVVDDPQMHCMDVLELSYKHLPDYLKSCFLYFGAFLEDEEIPVPKLTQLWMAEGFISTIESENIEDLAEEYLMDLIGRSLVMVARRRSGGGVKTCRVHDMLRELCRSKANEENFLRQLTVSTDASLDVLDYGDYHFVPPSNSITFEDHRLSLYSRRKHFVMSRPSGPWVRSLLFFASSDRYPRCPYDISFISEKFKFLKILNLECINMGVSFTNVITSLFHLRYLAVSGDIDSVPPSIANLWNLETFLLKGLKGMVEMPNTVWHMSRLRHLHVNNLAVFRLPDDNMEYFPQLHNLVTLSSPYLSYGEDADKVIRRIPNLRKLKCIFSESLVYPGNCNHLLRMDMLTQLVSLKLDYYGMHFNPVEFNFSLNLKKLALSNFRLPWDHISSIGRLQNLEVLKLISRAFEGERWDMREGEFTKLKFLKLENLNVVQWNASSDDLPNLQHLVLQSCKHLEKVPSSFSEIPTLQRIEVLWCGQSCEESVRTIKEEEVEGLEVLINLPFSVFGSLS